MSAASGPCTGSATKRRDDEGVGGSASVLISDGGRESPRRTLEVARSTPVGVTPEFDER